MTSDELGALADFSIDALTEGVDADWSTRAGRWNGAVGRRSITWSTASFATQCRSVRERSPGTSRLENCKRTSAGFDGVRPGSGTHPR
jgi:hypothetical protein